MVSPYHHSSDPGEEFSKLLHDTGFEVIKCEYTMTVYNFATLSIFTGDCGIHINLILNIIFMEAIWL
jgi:hypothetical protein